LPFRAAAVENLDCGFRVRFLVAPDVIMTNHHVAGRLTEAQAAQAVVRFDYEIDIDGREQQGREVKLAGTGKWLVASDESLDYALVRLAERATEIMPPNAAKREIIKPTAHTFTTYEPLVVLQHPVATPLKIAFGTVVAPADGQGVTYTVNTEGGSSGSPVMTTALETVALHRQGDTNTNRGIRMSAILRHLKEKGNSKYLLGD
jgi:V8-like Glu-specific endopeptidase